MVPLSAQKRDDREHAQDRAEANFKRKDLQNREASKAWSDYEASRDAEREKTARLRKLRLAKEIADAAAKASGKVAEVADAASGAPGALGDSGVKVTEGVHRPRVPSAASNQKAPAKKGGNAAKKPAKKPARLG
jgi:hypothetical protein